MIKKYKFLECIYREKSGHKSSDCKTVSDIKEHRLILSKKKYVSVVPELKNEVLSVLVIIRRV